MVGSSYDKTIQFRVGAEFDMNRRRFIAASSVGAMLGASGCLGGDDTRENTEATLGVDGEDLQLAPGEESVVKIQVANVGSVQFSNLPDPDSVDLDLTEAEFSEPPSGQDDADPPYWNWSPPDANVEISVPVHISTDVEPAEYRYSVTAWQVDVEEGPDRSRDDADSVTESSTITVTEE